jgi:hypothetical protein
MSIEHLLNEKEVDPEFADFDESIQREDEKLADELKREGIVLEYPNPDI